MGAHDRHRQLILLHKLHNCRQNPEYKYVVLKMTHLVLNGLPKVANNHETAYPFKVSALEEEWYVVIN
jgi:hypothetical protein